MKTLYNVIVIASCIALSAFADEAHDVFLARKDAILAQTVTVCGGVAFSVGRTTSPRSRGDAVGYTKAEEQAKWNLGDKFRATASWPTDVLEEEKDAVWIEYRSEHPERFSVFGMQRIYSKKNPPDCYVVVMAFPAEQVNVPAPTDQELQIALSKVRERRRLAALKKAQEEAAKQKTGDENNSAKNNDAAGQTLQKAEDTGAVKKHENLDEDLML
mgnify:CR=1 FL=1